MPNENHLMFLDCKVVYQCYRLYHPAWHLLTQDSAVTNILCEHMCYAADARFQYSGTIVNFIYAKISILKVKYHAHDTTRIHWLCVRSALKIR